MVMFAGGFNRDGTPVPEPPLPCGDGLVIWPTTGNLVFRFYFFKGDQLKVKVATFKISEISDGP